MTHSKDDAGASALSTESGLSARKRASVQPGLIMPYVEGKSGLHILSFPWKIALVAFFSLACTALSWMGWIGCLILILILGLQTLLAYWLLVRSVSSESRAASRRLLWKPVPALLALALLLVAYHIYSLGLVDGLVTGLSVTLVLLNGSYAAIVAFATTPPSAVIDGFATIGRPLSWFGLRPELFALAVAIFLRSIPLLAIAARTVHQAAVARGLSKNIRAHVLPFLIAALALAQQTGEALAARGVTDEDRGSVPDGV